MTFILLTPCTLHNCWCIFQIHQLVLVQPNMHNDRKAGVGLLYIRMDIHFEFVLLTWYGALIVLIRFLIPHICVPTLVSDLLKIVSYITKDIAK
jgi:hypothetical protein